jgi:hypothetical protein
MVFGLSGTGVRLAAEKVFAFSGMRKQLVRKRHVARSAAVEARSATSVGKWKRT